MKLDHVRTADELGANDLSATLDLCLTEEARILARECAARARDDVEALRTRFLEALDGAVTAPPPVPTLLPASPSRPGCTATTLWRCLPQ